MGGSLLKKNIIFAAVILVAAAVLAWFVYGNRSTGASALVTIANAKSHTVPLSKDGQYTFSEADGARLPVTLEVQDGQIRFINSQCPDHVCENFGWLQYAHDEAICLPAGVVVSVESTS